MSIRIIRPLIVFPSSLFNMDVDLILASLAALFASNCNQPCFHNNTTEGWNIDWDWNYGNATLTLICKHWSKGKIQISVSCQDYFAWISRMMRIYEFTQIFAESVSSAFFVCLIIMRQEIHYCFRDFLNGLEFNSYDRKFILMKGNLFLQQEIYSCVWALIFSPGIVFLLQEQFSCDMNNFLVTRNNLRHNKFLVKGTIIL